MLARRVQLVGFVVMALVACGGDGGPRFEPLDHQVAAVGQELVIELLASNDDGSPITYSFDSDAPGAGSRADLTQRPGGAAVFAWTPTAEDIGAWTFDFHAADGRGRSTESIQIEVRSAVGSESMPAFRRPLGAGTALNVAAEDCVEIEVEIDDQDTASVAIAQGEPVIEGGVLESNGLSGALWRWCPSAAQVAAQDRYLLTLVADDGDNPQALKRYQIVLRDESDKPQCSGQPPQIRHTARNHETIGALELTATVSDDKGLKGAPFLYYSTERPSEPPELSRMVQLPFELTEGSELSGTWSVQVPNPIAEGGGTDETLYYVIVAEDNDDRGGKCDHVSSSSFQALVSDPGGSGGAGLCEPCTSDAQCGEASDLCLTVGTEGDAFCFQSCDGPGSCPDGYICSPAEMTSREGNSARQCIPITESCDGDPSCRDDAYEQNDGRSQAVALDPGETAELRMCPVKQLGGDEDWYEIVVTEDSAVEIAIEVPADEPSPVPTFPDLNLRLFDASGRVIAVAEDAIDPFQTDLQRVTRCLTPGTYYARVYSYFSEERRYELRYDTSPMTCGSSTCEDDVYENDDGLADARQPDFSAGNVYAATDNQICEGDDDWYFVYLFGGDDLYVLATFEQGGPSEDLDILVYDGVGNLLTQCTEQDPSGCSDWGQSGTSDELLIYSPGDYGYDGNEHYVVVHGFGGSENAYDICIAINDETLCGL